MFFVSHGARSLSREEPLKWFVVEPQHEGEMLLIQVDSLRAVGRKVWAIDPDLGTMKDVSKDA